MTLNHSEIIDRYGVKRYYEIEKPVFVKLCKEKGLSQSKTRKVTNIWLKMEGRPEEEFVSLSYVKRNWT